jgi:hypothetical protein
VEYNASGKFKAVRAVMPGSSGTSDADAAYRRMLNPSKHGPLGVPTILRNLAESGEHTTFRSGGCPSHSSALPTMCVSEAVSLRCLCPSAFVLIIWTHLAFTEVNRVSWFEHN